MAIPDFHIPNAELTGQERNRQEEANNEHGNTREHPCNWFQAAITEALKDTRSNETHHSPPDHGSHCTYGHMVEDTGDGNQKNCTGWLT